MGEVRDRLATGNFNDMRQEKQPYQAVLVTLTKRGDPHVYRVVVKDLYGEHEQVLKEEITEAR